MTSTIGLNLRVTGYCNQGGRKYMEDVFSVAYQQTEDEKDLEYAFFGIFDGHGGREAAVFAKEHLMDLIVRQKGFWSDDDETVLKAIREGFIQTQQAMWKELETWPKTLSGLPSTAGTTASIAFVRRGKIFVGHVGDSAIVLGTQDASDPANVWRGELLTRDHKPESDEESRRIRRCGGKVVSKSGVPRVVWNRPRLGHKGPVRRSTLIDEIPFLAVARSLGDLWSYNSKADVFVVSPEPDTFVYEIDAARHRCLVLGTDGAWNMLTPSQAVSYVCQAERSNEQHMYHQPGPWHWVNPSKYLVDCAIERWTGNNLRADNTSIVTVMLDPPGPPRAHVVQRQRTLAAVAPEQQSPIVAKAPTAPSPHFGGRLLNDNSNVILSPRSKSALSRLTDRVKGRDMKKLKESRLSRELSALRLGAPSVTATSSSRRQQRSCESNTSDTENEQLVSNRVPRQKPQPAEKEKAGIGIRVQRSSCRLQGMKTDQPARDTRRAQPTSKNQPSSPEAKRTLRKRKVSEPVKGGEPWKSPRTATSSAILGKPVMTRSRTARVLHLKK